MNLKSFSPSQFFPLTIPFIIIASLMWLTQSSFFLENAQLLSHAITVDVLVIVPLLYFFIIRKRDIPKITIVTMFVLGLILLSYALPEENQSLLELVKTYFLPVLELGVFSFLIYKVVQLSKTYRKESEDSKDFYTILKESASQVFPKRIASILVTEICVVYYGFIQWKGKQLKAHEFTYHKKNALISILAGLTLIILAETIGLHSFLVKWNPIVGWIVTFVSAYTALQFFALIKSIVVRPIAIDLKNQILHLRYGYFTELSVAIEKIQSVELHQKDLPDDQSVLPFSPLGSIGEHNLILHFKEEIEFAGIYGMQRKAKSIALFIDAKEEFKSAIEKLLLNQK